MPRLLQEALWLGSAGQKDRAHSEDESRKVVWSKVEIGSGPGFAEGPGPDRRSVAPWRFDRTNAWTGINVSKLFDTKRLALCAPEQRKIGSPGERLYGQLHRLAPLSDCLNDSRRKKTERDEPPHRATVDSFQSCQVADRERGRHGIAGAHSRNGGLPRTYARRCARA
jgi:hypothetical protein